MMKDHNEKQCSKTVLDSETRSLIMKCVNDGMDEVKSKMGFFEEKFNTKLDSIASD